MPDDLGFALEYHGNGAGYTIAYLRDSKGVLRRATAEEEKMWKLLEDLTAKLGEKTARKGK